MARSSRRLATRTRRWTAQQACGMTTPLSRSVSSGFATWIRAAPKCAVLEVRYRLIPHDDLRSGNILPSESAAHPLVVALGPKTGSACALGTLQAHQQRDR